MSAPMRVAHVVTLVSDGGAYGGPVSVATAQLGELSARGHETVLLALWRGAGEAPSTWDGVRLHARRARALVPGTGFLGLLNPRLLRGLWRYAGDADVVHVHAGRDLVSLAALAVTALRGRRPVVQTHGMVQPRDGAVARVFDALYVPLLRRARACLVLTTEEAAALSHILGPEGPPLVPLRNGIRTTALAGRTTTGDTDRPDPGPPTPGPSGVTRGVSRSGGSAPGSPGVAPGMPSEVPGPARPESASLRAVSGVPFGAHVSGSGASEVAVPGRGPFPVDEVTPAASVEPGPARGAATEHGPAVTPQRTPRVLFLARMHPVKRPEAFVEAAAWVVGAGVGAEFVLNGADEGALDGVTGLIARHGLQRSVRYEGAVAHEEALRRIAEAAVYVLPSSSEVFPVSLLEALAAGTPTVCTDGCGIAGELAARGASVVTDGSPRALADAVLRLLANEDHARAVAAAGLRAVDELYSIGAVADRLEELYAGA
ncbi:glycosyltransferase [Streptomyces sp. NPDC054796]